jgi:hypothetical protein
MVTRFLDTADQYQQTFRNLTAEETRVTEEFRDDGRLRRKREITADLLVYVSPRAADVPVEYRDVKFVDGKAIERRDRRVLDLIRRATNARSAEEELRIVNRESQRYDFDVHVAGLTINQFFNRSMRNDFRFDGAGRDAVDGHETLVVTYRQIEPQPEFSGVTRAYRGMGVTSFFVRGRLWLDAGTFQLRRSRQEVVGVHPALPEPTTLISTDSAYADSRFGILVPSRLVFEWHESRSKSNPVFTLKARMTFTYGAFRRFEVATEQTIATPQ